MRAGRFLDAVQSFVDEPLGAELLNLGQAAAILGLRDGTFAVVVAGDHFTPEQLEAMLGEFVAKNDTADLKLVVVGGEAHHRAVLERVQPRLMMRRVVQAFALADDGSVWAGARSRLDSPTGAVLTALAARAVPREVDPAALLGRIAEPSAEDRAHAADARGFVDRTRAGLPIATLGILAIVAVCFGLEWLWGGTEFIPTLVRMGANTDTVWHGEPWRLWSSAWLHAGPLHVLANAYVLFALGGFLERLLGAPRFVVLYALAATGGGLASAALSDATLSVGASGAIWGVLGASVALAWRPAQLIPPSVLPAVRRNAVVNVAINVGVSFLPAIDLMAHLGGGIVGAALVLSGALTRGVTPSSRTAGPAWRAAAWASGVLLLGALVLGWARERPWALLATDGVQTQALVGTDATIAVPAAIGPLRAVADGEQTLWVAGDLLHDAAALVVAMDPHGIPSDDPEALSHAFTEFQRTATSTPEGATAVGSRRIVEGGAFPAFEERFAYDNGIQLIVFYQLRPQAAVRIDGAYWGDHPEWIDALRAAADSLVVP